MMPIQNQQTVKEVVSIETGSISPDGHHQWDGSKWIPVRTHKNSSTMTEYGCGDGKNGFQIQIEVVDKKNLPQS